MATATGKIDITALYKDKVSPGIKKTEQVVTKSLKAIAIAGTVIAGVTAVVGKRFLDTASMVEQYEFQLAALLGSQEAASDAMDHFQEVASRVPASLDQIIEAGTIVERFGARSDKWLEPLVDLSFIMGVELPEAASAFGRAFAGGAGAADIFRERGILQLIKDAKGIDDLTKLTLPQFRQAMIDTFTDPEGKIAGAAIKAADTWVGAMSMIGDAWFKFKTDVMDAGVFEYIKGVASVTVDFVKAADTSEIITDIATAAVTGLNAIAQGLLSIPSAFMAVRKVVNDVFGTWLEIKLGMEKFQEWSFKIASDPVGAVRWTLAAKETERQIDVLAGKSFDFEKDIAKWQEALAPFSLELQNLADKVLADIGKEAEETRKKITGDGDGDGKPPAVDPKAEAARQKELQDARAFQSEMLTLNFTVSQQQLQQFREHQIKLNELQMQGLITATDFKEATQELNLWHDEAMQEIRDQELASAQNYYDQIMEMETNYMAFTSENKAQLQALRDADKISQQEYNYAVVAGQVSANQKRIQAAKQYAATAGKLVGLSAQEQAKYMIPLETALMLGEIAKAAAAAAAQNYGVAGQHLLAAGNYAVEIKALQKAAKGAGSSSAAGSAGRSAGGGGAGGGPSRRESRDEREERERRGRAHIVVRMPEGVVVDQYEFARTLITDLSKAQNANVEVDLIPA
jgi:hypothetical protein